MHKYIPFTHSGCVYVYVRYVGYINIYIYMCIRIRIYVASYVILYINIHVCICIYSFLDDSTWNNYLRGMFFGDVFA